MRAEIEWLKLVKKVAIETFSMKSGAFPSVAAARALIEAWLRRTPWRGSIGPAATREIIAKMAMVEMKDFMVLVGMQLARE